VVLSVEREVVDVYRCLLMRDRIGEVYEGRVSGLSGSGLYVVLDDPFVDVLVRFESLGNERFEPSEDGLSVRAARSGERVSLGDRLTVVIEDVLLSRRSIAARRVVPGSARTDAGGESDARVDGAPAPRRSRRSEPEPVRAPAARGERRGAPGGRGSSGQGSSGQGSSGRGSARQGSSGQGSSGQGSSGRGSSGGRRGKKRSPRR
jgi:ribonuclease R